MELVACRITLSLCSLLLGFLALRLWSQIEFPRLTHSPLDHCRICVRLLRMER